MAFDEASYVQDFVKRVRGASVLPDDLMARYAITLPASDAEIAARVKAVRAYWNKAYLGKSMAAQVAKLCRAEDERLRAEHGAKMETRAWWDRRQSERQSAAEAAIVRLAAELRQRYGQLGVVTGGILGKFAAKLGLTQAQAAQAVERAGLVLAPAASLPESEPIPAFTALLKSMSESGAASVPELVHPGSGAFKLVDRYVCLADPGKRLDAMAVEAQIIEADKRGISATENARRSALMILRKAVRDGVDLRDVALYHLVTVARESAELSAGMAVDELRKTGLDRADASVIAALLTEHSAAAGTAGVGRVRELLRTGRLREAGQAARGLPENSGHRAEAVQLVSDARQQLDGLLAQAAAAAAVPDEVRAATLLKEAAQISAEDADEALAAIPLPPPAALRAVCEDAVVRLFWRAAAGHDRGTVYVVCRTVQRPPAAATDGEQVYRDHGDACADTGAPVGRSLHYGVFAVGGDGRPASRPATVPVTLLPPVSRLEAEAGPDSIALRWSAHPDAQEVRVTRAAPGGPARRVPATTSGCQVPGLTEGEPQHFEVIAIYRGPDGAELASAAEHINATPRSEARPIPKLRARTVETGGAVRIRVSWRPVDRSEVRIRRADAPPPWKFGTWVTQQQMAGYGHEVTGRALAGRAETGLEAELPPGVHHLVPFSIGGTGIVAGRCAAVAVTDPVRQLKVTPFGSYAMVSWEWPPGTQLAEVSWEADGNADCGLVSLAQYRSAGGARVPLGRGPCAIEVRAVIMVGETSFTAPPARAVTDEVLDVDVVYSVSATPSIGPFGGRSKKVVFRSDQGCERVHVRMVACPGLVMPTSAAAGLALLDTTLALEPGVPVEHQVSVPKSVKRPYWVRCFVVDGRARLVDPPISSLKET